MNTIVLATQNPGKVEELRSLLAGSPINILGLSDLDDSFPEPDEIGNTFIDNATIKAIEYAKMTDSYCLADDSGLEIDALDGKPGVISSHFAFDGDEDGEAAELDRAQRDELNSQRVMRELGGIEDSKRSARFVCTMVLSDPKGQVLATSSGSFEGRIGREDQVPKGENGFGYDPYFLVSPEFEFTSAQLSPAEKNAISHRASAVNQMIEIMTGPDSIFKEN